MATLQPDASWPVPSGGGQRAAAERAARARRGLRWVARGGFVALSVTWAVRIGLPADKATIFVWLWLGAVMWRWGAPLRSHLDFVKDWWPAFATMVFWTYSRGLADNLGTRVHVAMPIDVDRWLGRGELPGQRLQALLCGSGCTDPGTSHWYDTLFTATYMSHFVVGMTLALVLWLRARPRWAEWLHRYLALNLAGLAICVVYPMQPPWMASATGHLDPQVHRLTGRGGSVLAVHVSQMVMGPIGDQVAAMPSLHAGTACLVALFGIGRLRSRWRWLLLAYPLTMGLALVYFGEHYVVDVLAGYLLALLVHLGCTQWESHQRARSHHAGPAPAHVVGDGPVVGDHHDDATGRLRGHELAQDVVGDDPRGEDTTGRVPEAAASKTTVVSAPVRATSGATWASSRARCASRLSDGQTVLVTL